MLGSPSRAYPMFQHPRPARLPDTISKLQYNTSAFVQDRLTRWARRRQLRGASPKAVPYGPAFALRKSGCAWRVSPHRSRKRRPPFSANPIDPLSVIRYLARSGCPAKCTAPLNPFELNRADCQIHRRHTDRTSPRQPVRADLPDAMELSEPVQG